MPEGFAQDAHAAAVDDASALGSIRADHMFDKPPFSMTGLRRPWQLSEV
jgi:hypothetical protein